MRGTACFLDGYFRPLQLLFLLFWIQVWVSFQEFIGVDANFNFYLDRREFQKLHGISSDIYYVREGVVNEYATSFLVTVPSEVDDLNFSWQALTKRPVYYEMSIDYTDFFALLPPISNISNSGRVPQNLEVFRVSLPCSGRSNAEVSVTIRIQFQIKHPKLNTTTINIKRNKICLFKEPNPKSTDILPVFPAVAIETNSNPSNPSENNGTTFFRDPTPTLLLAGLLGGCAVTASAVFLTFFICLRRKLTPLPENGRSTLPAYSSCQGESDQGSSNKSSPACLLRQSQATGQSEGLTATHHNWKQFNSADKTRDPLSRSGSHNSYITIASFWNDIFNSGNPAPNVRLTKTQPPTMVKNSNVLTNQSQGAKGSDVSPYAYAHVVPPSPMPPPLPKVGAPPLIEWYSQYPCQSSNSPNTTNSFVSHDKGGHVYSNNLHTFSPKPKHGSSGSQLVRNSVEYDDANSGGNSSTIKSTAGSLIQVGGFQCRRNFTKEENVVERFL